MNCIETLAQLQNSNVMHDVFLKDTKAAYSTMVKTEEVRGLSVEYDAADQRVEEGDSEEGA